MQLCLLGVVARNVLVVGLLEERGAQVAGRRHPRDLHDQQHEDDSCPAEAVPHVVREFELSVANLDSLDGHLLLLRFRLRQRGRLGGEQLAVGDVDAHCTRWWLVPISRCLDNGAAWSERNTRRRAQDGQTDA